MRHPAWVIVGGAEKALMSHQASPSSCLGAPRLPRTWRRSAARLGAGTAWQTISPVLDLPKVQEKIAHARQSMGGRAVAELSVAG